MFRRLIFGLFLTLLLIYASESTARDKSVFAQGDPASEILQLINQFRASQGLPPFEYNGVLANNRPPRRPARVRTRRDFPAVTVPHHPVHVAPAAVADLDGMAHRFQGSDRRF